MSDQRGKHRRVDDDADDRPVLPPTTTDERETGWGDDAEGGRRDRDWYLRERPPHHE